MSRLTRRRLLLAAGASGLGVAAGAGFELARPDGADDRVAFHGETQAGIATPAQDRLHFAAFDVPSSSRAELRDLLRDWSAAAELMTRGLPAGPVAGDELSPPADTGEAVGLAPSRLTITFGFGPSLFDDRFGLASRRPESLIDLPEFGGDALQADRSGGDLCVQACADDPQVAFHAVRNLARIGRGVAYLRWSQLGFGRTSTTSRAQSTPRNLMGFKDGTNNIKLEDTAALREYVWVGANDEPSWMRDGTYLVARRIRMLIEVWDRASLGDQERTIGRAKSSGAPIGKDHEFDPVDLKAKLLDGTPAIPVDAHVRLANGEQQGRPRILRRGYSFTDGVDERLGQLDAGLFFLCFQRDPRSQFVALQRRLASNDALNEYITHTGSAIFACPPGAQAGGYVGETLL